jgi:ethanolamine utilization microcompartment shell protein EutL
MTTRHTADEFVQVLICEAPSNNTAFTASVIQGKKAQSAISQACKPHQTST